MHEAYLEVNKVRTKVTTFGRWVEESPKTSEDIEDIVLIIPGNPGITSFYNIFAKTLHDKLGYPVWCIGHAGHNFPDQPIMIPKLEVNKELYGLKGQIQHKVDFIEKYLSGNVRLHLIGHSIGSYMILELLEHPSLKDKVADVSLLFPTIEHMATTSNGKFMTGFVKHIVWLIVFLSWFFTVLPSALQFILVYIYMTIVGMPNPNLDSIMDLVKPGVLKRVFFLAYEEMDQVKERNNEVIKRNCAKINFHYGVNDGWAPKSFCDRLKNDIPNVHAQTSNINHAFVLKRSVEVGKIVADWIKGKQ
ncbi:unnamed protein product [Phaedon cochleariae]|uniref:Lipid droplet-associated hydrolase n=1 Tax=Phaedon cochleariae TaxID=80249 RepID=A0A9N9SD12_PHACE|nr:unnamed protein product [Phaedon cochleariae]